MSGNKLEDFDLRFLQIETKKQNVVYSPLSIKYALQMLGEGASGKSKAQIDALIGDYESKKYTNNSNMTFANAMFIRNTFKDSIKDNYIKTLQDKYNAEVIYDSFKDAKTINKWVNNKTFNLIDNLVDDKNMDEKMFILVNALAIDMEWNKKIQATSENYKDNYFVSYKHEKYSEFISPIFADVYDSVSFNNNTIKAKASEIGASINNYDIVNELGEDNIRKLITKEYEDWLKEGSCGGGEPVKPFVDNFIKELDSNYKQVEASTDFKFHVDDDVKVFAKELKEYNGTTLEYIGIMPKNKPLDEFIKSSDAKSINNILNKIKTVELNNFEKGKVTKIIGGIPLFKYDYKLNLFDDLKKLGVTDIFDLEKVNLSNLTTDKTIVISDITHKANIEFSNDGIKAAAATQSGGAGSASCNFEHLFEVPVVEIDLTFDNPYLYLIRDKNTEEIWFIGTVYEPTINERTDSRIINEK